MASIYVVEDDPDIRDIETITLNNSGHEATGFDCGQTFLDALNRKVPDLCILDIMLPDMDGYEILKKLRRNSATLTLPVIMVTARTGELDMVKGLDMGADDYIRKPFSVIELITRVKAVLRRTMESEAPVKNRNIMEIGGIELDDERHSVSAGGNPVDLTYKEYELLKVLMLNCGIVLSRDVIMERVWGTQFEGETRTVDMHIKTLRQKLQDCGKAIRTVRNVGYVIDHEEHSQS